MQDLQVFQSSEFGELGVLIIEGREYFPATACAKILGYSNTKDAIKRHCRWVVKHDLPHPQNPEKTIEMNFIPEGDLYRLIVSSKLPTAERFERWIFDEVLPALRRQGYYGSPSASDIQAIITQAVTAAVTETVKQLLPLMNVTPDDGFDQSYPYGGDVVRTRKRRYSGSVISRLDDALRKEVDMMVCSERYTYQDVVDMLTEHGISLSLMAVCRYAKRFR